ncbi:glycoside hydrolase family 16 protein [Desarmillaria tabescens]|uniref:Glycoside hydrolase family 16 protein n=1 Tax=Armillaria tabescens TaxID=1929756 RepID=A0AA39N4L7_ARMTA|nr:glycoside hydrolase family 16 protein [Desarmillaria tabescens]KAK0457727.1 glycoside hydrolase family 16 protein [Desarmillaria tabescens]
MFSLFLLALFMTISIVIAEPTFYLTQVVRGNDFFDAFKWETFDDPTHGRVNYVDQDTAKANNLSYASPDNSTFVMRADSSTVVPSYARGRDSVRISSWASHAQSLMILDLQHMPVGCGTWPAFWTLSKDGPWPQGGEIDIIEGVNMNCDNLASLHTTEDCTMPDTRAQRGYTVSSDCNAAVNSNQGCGTSFTQPFSYGTGFNQIGGGYFAMSKDDINGVRVWFWPRNSSSIPAEVIQPSNFVQIRTDNWGSPDASFPVDRCGYDAHFLGEHITVFDITFCGDWAGSAFATSGCGPSTCEQYVESTPAAFSEAYWEINTLYIYDRCND